MKVCGAVIFLSRQLQIRSRQMSPYNFESSGSVFSAAALDQSPLA